MFWLETTRFDPVIVTVVPPAIGPELGTMAEIVGAVPDPLVNVKAFVIVCAPSPLLMTTSAAPADAFGACNCSSVSVSLEIDAEAPAKVTVVEPEAASRFSPVMVTAVPLEPLFGEMPVTIANPPMNSSLFGEPGPVLEIASEVASATSAVST